MRRWSFAWAAFLLAGCASPGSSPGRSPPASASPSAAGPANARPTIVNRADARPRPSAAKAAGRAAGAHGDPKESCPYQDRVFADAWLAGWQEASPDARPSVEAGPPASARSATPRDEARPRPDDVFAGPGTSGARETPSGDPGPVEASRPRPQRPGTSFADTDAARQRQRAFWAAVHQLAARADQLAQDAARDRTRDRYFPGRTTVGGRVAPTRERVDDTYYDRLEQIDNETAADAYVLMKRCGNDPALDKDHDGLADLTFEMGTRGSGGRYTRGHFVFPPETRTGQ
jgi:ribosome modulation factor